MPVPGSLSITIHSHFVNNSAPSLCYIKYFHDWDIIASSVCFVFQIELPTCTVCVKVYCTLVLSLWRSAAHSVHCVLYWWRMMTHEAFEIKDAPTKAREVACVMRLAPHAGGFDLQQSPGIWLHVCMCYWILQFVYWGSQFPTRSPAGGTDLRWHIFACIYFCEWSTRK